MGGSEYGIGSWGSHREAEGRKEYMSHVQAKDGYCISGVAYRGGNRMLLVVEDVVHFHHDPVLRESVLPNCKLLLAKDILLQNCS